VNIISHAAASVTKSAPIANHALDSFAGPPMHSHSGQFIDLTLLDRSLTVGATNTTIHIIVRSVGAMTTGSGGSLARKNPTFAKRSLSFLIIDEDRALILQ
jgi:hypothetical protein